MSLCAVHCVKDDVFTLQYYLDLSSPYIKMLGEPADEESREPCIATDSDGYLKMSPTLSGANYMNVSQNSKDKSKRAEV